MTADPRRHNMQSVGYAISGVCQTISQSQLVIVSHSHESKVIMNLVTLAVTIIILLHDYMGELDG